MRSDGKIKTRYNGEMVVVILVPTRTSKKSQTSFTFHYGCVQGAICEEHVIHEVCNTIPRAH